MIERSIHGNYAIFCLPKNNFCFFTHSGIPLCSQRRKATKEQRILFDFYFTFSLLLAPLRVHMGCLTFRLRSHPMNLDQVMLVRKMNEQKTDILT